MTSPVVVGNDVVDLADARTRGQSKKRRFLHRVFTATERASIVQADDPDLELWSRWAAKEAGFKVVSKVLGDPPTFVHQAFAVEWASATTHAPEAQYPDTVRIGTVRYEPTSDHGSDPPISVPVSVQLLGTALHSVGYGPFMARSERPSIHRQVAHLESLDGAWAGDLDNLMPKFTPQEADAVYSRESAAVRLGARSALSGVLDTEEEHIEIVCAPGTPGRRPPRVLVHGQEGLADVSLSHDGSWIAWAIWCA